MSLRDYRFDYTSLLLDRLQCCNESCVLCTSLALKAVISPSFVLDATILLLHFNRGGCGYGSESEGEEPADSRVTLPQNMPGRGNAKAQQSAIRLTEVLQKSCVLRCPIMFASFFIHPSILLSYL